MTSDQAGYPAGTQFATNVQRGGGAQESLREFKALLRARPTCERCRIGRSTGLRSRDGRREIVCRSCADADDRRPSGRHRRVRIKRNAVYAIRTRLIDARPLRRDDAIDLSGLASDLIALGERLAALAGDRPDTAQTIELLMAAGLNPASVDALLSQIGY